MCRKVAWAYQTNTIEPGGHPIVAAAFNAGVWPARGRGGCYFMKVLEDGLLVVFPRVEIQLPRTQYEALGKEPTPLYER